MSSTPPPRQTMAGGLPIAVGAMAGAAIGLYAHQPTIGFLIGIGVGIALAILIWLLDRR